MTSKRFEGLEKGSKDILFPSLWQNVTLVWPSLLSFCWSQLPPRQLELGQPAKTHTENAVALSTTEAHSLVTVFGLWDLRMAISGAPVLRS